MLLFKLERGLQPIALNSVHGQMGCGAAGGPAGASCWLGGGPSAPTVTETYDGFNVD